MKSVIVQRSVPRNNKSTIVVPVSKSGPAHILTTDPDIVSLVEQRADGESLADSPIQTLARLQLFQSGANVRLLQVGMDVQIRRIADRSRSDVPDKEEK